MPTCRENLLPSTETTKPIQQDTHPHASALRLTVTRLARQLRKNSGTALTPAQMSALDVLGRKGPLRLGHLAKLEGISKPTATRLTDKLEDTALVERVHDDADGRSCHIRLTAKGESLLTDASRGADQFLSSQLSALTPPDQLALKQALPVLTRLLETNA
ncbi:MarR family winged helix-turn-helix transcriptional regulator [Paenarthrobacter sp. NPDC058040]|uniref:MarR family winged helix-turn-helix transcriptional regulator n=1 Tax=unclassified Paenarthrobacter TaxID=2634190 RepID=UPI0036D88D68